MGLSERISGWLQRRKEAVHRQRIYRASAYFGSLLKHGEADAVAVRRCVEDYKDFPEMTKRQVELLLERAHGALGVRVKNPVHGIDLGNVGIVADLGRHPPQRGGRG